MTDAAPANGELLQVVRRTGTRELLIVLVLGAVIGAVATYYMASGRGVPTVVQGTVSAVAADSDDGDVTAIAIRFDGHDYLTPGEGESVPVVANLPWTDATGKNFAGGRPVCLAPGTYGQRVEVGVLDVRGEGAWDSRLVVWVHCLS
jgi:hypothetical protein